MGTIKPDLIESFINEGNFEVDEIGPLYSPLLDLKIRRDKKLKLIITTTSDLSSKTDCEDHPPGTVRINERLIRMTSTLGAKIELTGIQPFNHSISTDSNGKSTKTELSSVEKALVQIRDSKSGCYLIEWLENVDDGTFLWPETTKCESKDSNTIVIGSGPTSVEISETSTSGENSRNCIPLSVDSTNFHLVTSRKDENSLGVNSGYILYSGVPSDHFRKKVRNCLSFIMGRPLIQTGHSIFDSDWKIVSLEAISSYSVGQAVFNIHSMPPAPLGSKYQGELDERIVSSILLSIYRNYDQYNFGYLSWTYWHAICAPAHIAAVHFGACIESLQRSFINNNGKLFRTSLIEKSDWKPFRKNIQEILKEMKIGETEREVLENKVNSLNQTPQSILTERFLDTLDIQLSELEKSAWKQRNNAAHGNETEEGGEIKLIREIKVLKVMFHRVFLKIVNGGDHYIDYYSIGFPIKKLKESIENDA
ncbi:MAG: hypothetical protein ACQEW7_11585 [Pseudomonadota bacterium]